MANEKILVVDDAEIVCTAFERELGQEGYEVDSAPDGENALEKAKSKQYDLIFIDLVMPGINGIETCRAIKEVSPETVLVFMTGNVSKNTTWDEVEFSKAGGKVYYLYKPFSNNEIIEVAKQALSER